MTSAKSQGATITPSVLCISLNPALDQTIEVFGLCPGQVNRAHRAQIDVGGKGINVASCLADFGAHVAVTGLLGRDNAAMFESLFRGKGISNHCLYLNGLTRINTKIVDSERKETTDVNMPGVQSSPEQIAEQIENLFEVIDQAGQTARWVVLSGSLPPGWPADTYARLIQRAKQNGAKVLLDASTSALSEGIKAAPHIIKPNRDELAELVGVQLTTFNEVTSAALALLREEADLELVAVSLGGEGALFVSRTEVLHAQPLQVTMTSSVGAGDAMVAGIVAAQLESLSLIDCARLSTSFSAAKLTRLGPHLPDEAQVRQLAEQVRVIPLAQ